MDVRPQLAPRLLAPPPALRSRLTRPLHLNQGPLAWRAGGHSEGPPAAGPRRPAPPAPVASPALRAASGPAAQARLVSAWRSASPPARPPGAGCRRGLRALSAPQRVSLCFLIHLTRVRHTCLSQTTHVHTPHAHIYCTLHAHACTHMGAHTTHTSPAGAQARLARRVCVSASRSPPYASAARRLSAEEHVLLLVFGTCLKDLRVYI